MLRSALLVALLVPLALLPSATAKEGPDFVVELRPGAAPSYEGPEGLLRLVESRPGERVAWNLSLAQDYTVGEFRVRGAFDVARREQVVPSLEGVPATQYPLFHPFPDALLWTADGPSQVYGHVGEAPDFTLRLGFVGPANVTLVLQRDVAPPVFMLGPVENLTWRDFYQETSTHELAIADLRIRPAGSGGEWVENPTPSFHVRQRFPIQGLRPDTEYEAQVVFTDWAGNEDRSPVYRLRTLPEPVRPVPLVSVLDPAPNATVNATGVLVRARVESPQSPVDREGVRVFFDKKELHEGWAYQDGVVELGLPSLEPGKHSVSIEALNEAGGKGVARWTFEVADPRHESPPAGVGVLLAGLVLVALALRRRA